MSELKKNKPKDRKKNPNIQQNCGSPARLVRLSTIKLWLPVHCPSNRHTQNVRRGPGVSVGHRRVDLQRGGGSVGSSKQQRGLCTATRGRAPRVRPQVTAGQRAAAGRGGTRHGGEVDLIVGLMRKPSGVASLVAPFAVGRMLHVGHYTEGHLEVGLLAGGAVLAEQHRGAGLVQTHRLHKPPLGLWKCTEKRASEKLSHNLNFYCISCLLFHLNASLRAFLQEFKNNLKSCSYFSLPQ